MTTIPNNLKTEVVKQGVSAIMDKHPIAAFILVLAMSGGAGSIIPNLFGSGERITVLETKVEIIEKQQVKTDAVLSELNKTMVGLQTTMSALNATLTERGK
ncbi:hypothetical protein [Edwardsiella tarda]|uniref:hypothetical protein n=1 Tax=Edwardsiella tarda TaxID=636 RepID=UPI00083A528B|nr:hypothetical protein [Edwardsiella tarda]